MFPVFEEDLDNLVKGATSCILSHFFDGLNYCYSVAKPKNNGLLKEEKHQWGDSKTKKEQGWLKKGKIETDF